MTKYWELWAFSPLMVLVAVYLLRLFLVWNDRRRTRKQGFYCYPGLISRDYRPNTRRGTI